MNEENRLLDLKDPRMLPSEEEVEEVQLLDTAVLCVRTMLARKVDIADDSDTWASENGILNEFDDGTSQHPVHQLP